ncbi:MAG: FtsX-like permease family protein, partial [Candidatus Brocadiia bacterium]
RGHPNQDFAMLVPIELLAQSERTARTFDIIMVSIASISLLVGGIGIMNIMLATVTERTREIGTRRAVGAQKIDILLQFLFETVMLAFTGGMIGVFLGVVGAWAIAEYSQWKVIVTWQSIVLSFGISGIVGIIFGTYPAIKAANLSPIEALRYE